MDDRLLSNQPQERIIIDVDRQACSANTGSKIVSTEDNSVDVIEHNFVGDSLLEPAADHIQQESKLLKADDLQLRVRNTTEPHNDGF